MQERVARYQCTTRGARNGRPDGRPRAEPSDLVVLLNSFGRPAGAVAKESVHGVDTPLHLAFSCHVVDHDGRVLVTRRASSKRTWPGAWSNACCGHPLPDETLREAVTRRLGDELGLTPLRMGIAVPDFVYRAAMVSGVTEHELCPVVIAEVTGEPLPDPAEVSDVEWFTWEALLEQARRRPDSLSPWSATQIIDLAALTPSLRAWLDDHVGSAPALGEVGLDRPMAGSTEAGVDASRGLGSRDAMAPVGAPLEQIFEWFLAAREKEVADLDPTILQISGEVRALVEAGGKRLRPAFVYWGYRSGGADHDDGVLIAAAALELLHSFALIHDDVIDRSGRRRGRPTAWAALAAAHRGWGSPGDCGWFGLSGALLAGDLAFVWADQLLDSAPLSPHALERARRVFNQLRTEVIGGQYLDLRLSHRRAGSEEEARRVALLKSARYTVTRPLQLGAALAGNESSEVAAALACYGDAVGLAFQLRDDVLGLFGDPTRTGKSSIDDLREGKRTLLVLRALRLVSGDDLEFLERALGDPTLDEEAARNCCRIIAASGALASVEALIDAQHARALEAISGIGGSARDSLAELGDMAIRRDH